MIRKAPAQIWIDSNCPEIPQELDRRCSRMPWTEFGLAERFIARYGHLFRYVEAWKKWLYFDGRCWVKSDLASERLAKMTINRLKHEAILHENPNANDKPTES